MRESDGVVHFQRNVVRAHNDSLAGSREVSWNMQDIGEQPRSLDDECRIRCAFRVNLSASKRNGRSSFCKTRTRAQMLCILCQMTVKGTRGLRGHTSREYAEADLTRNEMLSTSCSPEISGC